MRDISKHGLYAIGLFRGKLYVRSGPDAVSQSSCVRIGTSQRFLTAISDAPPPEVTHPTHLQFDVARLDETVSVDAGRADGDSAVNCWVDHLEDWSLMGENTIQIMINRNWRDISFRIQFESPILVPPTTGDLNLIANLATHRGAAELILRFVDKSTGAETIRNVPFDARCRGGRNANSYQKVAVPIPEAEASGCAVHVAINYIEYSSDGTDDDPYLFMSRPRVVRTGATAELDAPIQFFSDKAEGPSEWFAAPLPAPVGAGDIVEVDTGSHRVPIYTGSDVQVSLHSDYGHSLELRSDKPFVGVLCVDDQSARRVSLNADPAIVRIPEHFLDGRWHVISVKDLSSSQTVWSTPALLPSSLTSVNLLQTESRAPFPIGSFPQTPYRYVSLKAQLANATSRTDLSLLSHCIATLEGGSPQVDLLPLAFPEHASPDVSIVIPAHNNIEMTYLALCSLLLAYNEASFEVILVDDASTDRTAEIEELVSGITVVRNDTPQRFLQSCNSGASKAKGEYIALLNNDVEVTAGWLDNLIDGFRRFDNVGIAGPKLIYPDGRLQEAGGIVWNNGNPWNYGNAQNPAAPEYCYARQVDYLSGAGLMIRRDIWETVDGLSSYLVPMYFEDTDLAFKVRAAGYSTWFIPSSIVFHYEGMSSGTALSFGFKRYQEINRPKFKKRWSQAFAKFGREPENPHIEKDRGIVGRVLFIDYALIRPDQDAGSYAALQEIRLVQALGYKVTFLPQNLGHIGSYTSDLQDMGVEVVHAPFYLSAAEFIERRGSEFDAVYITRYHVARDTLGDLRRCAPQAKILFNNADLHFLREIRSARANHDNALLEKARQTRNDELAVMTAVDLVLSYNPMEHAVIEAHTEGEAAIMQCPWVLEIPPKAAKLGKRSGLSFLGGFRHYPNAEGLKWFVEEILPHLEAELPDLTLAIYGSAMTDEIRELASETVTPVGYVDKLEEAFAPHRVFVAPLLSGAGIKGKVLEALAHGIPSVLSPVAAEGIGVQDGVHCFIANNVESWVKAVSRLMTDDDAWRKMSAKSRKFAEESFSFDKGLNQMRTAFEAVGLYKKLESDRHQTVRAHASMT